MNNITSNPIDGSMYAFPKIHLNENAIEAATIHGMVPDYFYCT